MIQVQLVSMLHRLTHHDGATSHLPWAKPLPFWTAHQNFQPVLYTPQCTPSKNAFQTVPVQYKMYGQDRWHAMQPPCNLKMTLIFITYSALSLNYVSYHDLTTAFSDTDDLFTKFERSAPSLFLNNKDASYSLSWLRDLNPYFTMQDLTSGNISSKYEDRFMHYTLSAASNIVPTTNNGNVSHLLQTSLTM